MKKDKSLNKEIYDASVLTDSQLLKEWKRLKRKGKTNDDWKLLIEIEAELGFRDRWRF